MPGRQPAFQNSLRDESSGPNYSPVSALHLSMEGKPSQCLRSALFKEREIEFVHAIYDEGNGAPQDRFS